MIGKVELRREARRRLTSIPTAERARLAQRIETAVWTLPEARAARVLLLYASVGAEVPTDLIAAEARLRGIEVVYPRCLPGEVAMALHSVAAEEELRADGSFGIREPPPDCPLVAVREIDLAFIPGLAWDRTGNRLGRGAGYYDRLLADPDWRAVRCGLFFSVQEFAAIPAEPWDQRLDAIVTDAGVVRTSA